MQLSHTGSDEMLGKIKKSWGKLREVMGQFPTSYTRRCNRLQLLTKPLSLLYEIGFIDHRSRFHISRLFYWSTHSNKKKPPKA